MGEREESLAKKALSALREEGAERAEEILAGGGRLKSEEAWGLFKAALRSSRSAWLVRSMIQAGFDPGQRGPGGSESALIEAVRQKSEEAARELLEAGANPNERMAELMVGAAHWAATRSDEGMLRLLLGFGADARLKDGKGREPLHLLGGYGGAKACEALLEFGADPGAKGGSGLTPLLGRARCAARAWRAGCWRRGRIRTGRGRRGGGRCIWRRGRGTRGWFGCSWRRGRTRGRGGWWRRAWRRGIRERGG